jgi:hypothetical protein
VGVRRSGRGDSRDPGSCRVMGANYKILGLFHDDGIYTVVGQSLYQGDGYRIISLPTAPPQTKYPFLYSYLLSWIWVFSRIFPQNILALKTLNLGILSTSLSCFQYRGNRLRPSRLHQPECFCVYGLCRQ